MAQTRTITGLIGNTQGRPGIELMARRGPVLVNTATDLTTDFAFQRDAARRDIIGAFHAHQLRRQRYRHRYGNTRATKGLGQFGRVKIDPVAGTARTAAFADRACAGRFNHD